MKVIHALTAIPVSRSYLGARAAARILRCAAGKPFAVLLPGCASRWPASCAVRQGSRLLYHYLGARAAGPHPALCGREVVCRTITWVREPLARILRCAAGKSFAVPLPGCASRWPASCAVRQGSRLPYHYLGARAAGPHPALCGREVVCRTITWVRGPLACILRCAAGKPFAVSTSHRE